MLALRLLAWRADRRDRSQLESELAATKLLLTAADARQHDRDVQLAQSLAALAAEKRTIVTPAQIIRDLPSQIPLPSPIVLQSAPASSNSTSPQSNAVIPTEDLKPLYDFALDCKACQAKLTAAQGNLTDERKKSAALTKNAMTLFTSPAAAALGAASAVPPSGSHRRRRRRHRRQSRPLAPHCEVDTFLGYNPRTESF